MTLTQAVMKKNALKKQGIRCQIKCLHGSNDSALWTVLVKDIDYCDA